MSSRFAANGLLAHYSICPNSDIVATLGDFGNNLDKKGIAFLHNFQILEQALLGIS